MFFIVCEKEKEREMKYTSKYRLKSFALKKKKRKSSVFFFRRCISDQSNVIILTVEQRNKYPIENETSRKRKKDYSHNHLCNKTMINQL